MRNKYDKIVVILVIFGIALLAGTVILAIKYFQQPTGLVVTYENFRSTSSSLEDASNAIVEHVITEDIDSDYDKYLALHDWLCNNVEYDFGGLNSEDPEVHDPRLVLYFGRGVCDGYSYAYQALCEAAGLECGVVFGLADITDPNSPHAWNTVYVDGDWYQVDVTWDDTTDEPSFGYELRYDYWLRGTTFMTADGREKPASRRGLSEADYIR